jgi:hypothetical protein
MSVLIGQEGPLIDKLLKKLNTTAPVIFAKAQNWFSALENLEAVIMSFPSLFEKPTHLQRKALYGEERSELSLLDSLLIRREGDKTLYLPARATLGKGFLTAKYHLFNLLIHGAEDAGMDSGDIQALRNLKASMVFTLMAEDVYLNLLDDASSPDPVRRQVALALMILWEHRSDFIIQENHVSVLREVWEARKNLVPVFGTMMGMSELMLISMDLDIMWTNFIKESLSGPDVRLALEEFLMGLSYEQIRDLRRMMQERHISAINRDEVAALLHENVKAGENIDVDDFYMMYTIRRDNARARKRLRHEGPHNTLEDYYIAFVFEEYRKKDFNGIDIPSE